MFELSYELNAYAAEKILGRKRRNCTKEIGTKCRWCGEEVPTENAEPCPQYAFPQVKLEEVLLCLGRSGYYVGVTYDPKCKNKAMGRSMR